MPETAELTTSIGTTGLIQYDGRIDEEYLRELYGRRWLRVVRQMVNDPTICAALLAIEMLLRQVTYDIVPVDDTPDAQAAADFVSEAWADMVATWPDTLAEILSMLPYGWCALELIYKVRRGIVLRDDGSEDTEQSSQYTDGKIAWACWSPRAQETLERWQFGDGGAVLGLWQTAPPSYQTAYIPIEKMLHLKTTSRKGSPEGKSLLRGAYRPWYFKNNIENIEGIGIERDLAGFPVVRIPAADINAKDQTKYNAWKQVATNIKRDEQEGIVIASDVYPGTSIPLYSVDLLSSSGKREFDTDAIINRYDARIAMAMLADVLLMGHDKVGSFALSSNKTELLGVALGAILETISLGVAAQAFRRLLRLNGMDEALTPTLAHGDVETADLDKLGNYMLHLEQAGMHIFPNPTIEQYLLEQAKIPVPEGGYDPVEEPDVAVPPAPAPAPVEGDPAKEEAVPA